MKFRLSLIDILITIGTLAVAAIWAFPLYWTVVTTLKPEYEVVAPGVHLFPQTPTLGSYTYVLTHTIIGQWYVNSVVTAGVETLLAVSMSAGCAYAVSQLSFPGRRLLYGIIVASFMVPIPALIVAHFVLMNDFGLINTWAGIVLPQLMIPLPIAVMIYKQFFDAIPREFREAAMVDGANEFDIFLKVFIPMTWGVTAALAIYTFIITWNNFFYPFLLTTSDTAMTVPVGITQVHDAFGVQYARNLAGAVLAALPVAAAYLIFQRRVTEAIMLSAGIKG
jgi:multiple sugar transport system permease protein